MAGFAGRIEAQFTVPASTSVSVSNSGGGPTTSTVPADDYYLTAAGSVSGLIAAFQSQLNTDRAPSSGSWTVTVSTGASGTGQVSIGCSGTTAIPSFSLVWTSTALRDLLGFTRNIDYPQTAADLAADLGYGTWTGGVGYLCNEASGNLASAFGSPATLSKTGTWTYSVQGPRGGSDKAITPAAGNNYFDGGDVFDVGASDDLIVAWVGRWNGAPTASATCVSKLAASAAAGWALYSSGTGMTAFAQQSGGGAAASSSASHYANEWHAGIMVIDRAASAIRIGLQGLTSATQSLGLATSLSGVGSLTTAATFRVGASAWTSAAQPNFDLDVCYVVSGSAVATGLSANLSTALANFAATFGTRTGTKQAKGLWRPNAPLLMADNSTKHAPRITDLRTTIGPTGQTYSLSGNSRREQTSLKWSYVDKSQVWESDATIANSSWETFLDDTQFGVGHAWFGVSIPVQIYDNAGFRLGEDADLDGWTIVGVTSMNAKRTDARGYDGLWTIEIPRLVASD